MPIIYRKRRAPAEDVNGEITESLSTQNDGSRKKRKNLTGSLTHGTRLRRQSVSQTPEGEDDELDKDIETHSGTINKEQLVKNLVRLALSTEFTRTPLRRQDISSKVFIGSTGRGKFKEIFEAAQGKLRSVFGMELVELPRNATKQTMAARRAAAQAREAPQMTGSYILISVLPDELRRSSVLYPYGFKDQTYTGLVLFVVSLIYLSRGVIGHDQLQRQLKNFNAEDWTPVDKTDKVLGLMVKHGYLTKQKDSTSEETQYEYGVGPRAKAEIGEEGIMNMVNEVYGVEAPDDLEERARRNMGIVEQRENETGKGKGKDKRREIGEGVSDTE